MKFQAIAAEHGAHIPRCPAATPEGIEAAEEASKWYSRGIRARPRFRVVRYTDLPRWRSYRLWSARSPILDANAFDAHFYAGHGWRAGYYEWRYQRRRRALLRGAFRSMRRGYLDLAFLQLDWIEVGRHRPAQRSYDAFELVALAGRDKLAELMHEVHLEAGPGGDVEASERVEVEMEAGTATISQPPE